jgi:hypothetical protein
MANRSELNLNHKDTKDTKNSRITLWASCLCGETASAVVTPRLRMHRHVE